MSLNRFPGLLALALAGGVVAPRLAAGGTQAEEAPALLAPVDFVVVDVEATVRLLGRNGELVPVVIRRKQGVSGEIIAELRAAFAQTRAAFVAAVEKSFGARVLGAGETNSAAFRVLRLEFQASNPDFPVHPVLAQIWARGYSGDATLERLVAPLREVMEHRLVGPLRSASTVFLADPATSGTIRSWGEAALFAAPMDASQVSAVEEVGLELRRMLDIGDRAAGGYLSGLLRPNFETDPHLTGLLLRERLGARAVSRSFVRGERICEVGQPLDRWAELALEYLKRVASEPETARPVVAAAPFERAKAVEPAGRPFPDAGRSWVLVFLIAIVLAGFGLLAVVAWTRWRRRPETEDMLSSFDPTVPEGGLREALLPFLAREMKDRLVRVLFAQRRALLANEDGASRKVAEMEARMARLQPAFSEKIRGYEERIRMLERKLEVMDQENRELIRAKLVLARKELGDLVTRDRLEWN